VKELIWIFQRNDVNITKDWMNFGMHLDRNNNYLYDMFDTCKLQINGTDRMTLLPAKYYRIINKFVHTNIPAQNFIYNYNFCLYPEKIQPSGTMNFSQIDNTKLIINNFHNLSDVMYKIKIYAINYNILIITNGMAGLLFN
jgi:hypothetical protein